MDIEKAVGSLFLIGVGVAALMLPLWHYVLVGWRVKRKDIMDGLNPDARLAYFEMFSRSDPTPSAADASANFEQLYSRWYGRRFFLMPGLLLFLAGLIGVALVVFTSLDNLHWLESPLPKLPDTATAAVAGAYLWVVNDLTSRARRLDFAPSDVLWSVLRLTVAVPMGYAFAAAAAPAVGALVAFSLGAFPLAGLVSMLQRLANKNIALQPTAEETSDDIIKLQGVNRTIVERLSNEDISTVTQIAYCDPVRLIMRSNLSFNFVTDCMNQALAWMYLQGDLDVIRPLGMRGAVEIKDLVDDLDKGGSSDPALVAAHDRAAAALPLIAAAIKQTPATLELAFRQIAEDPYTVFLNRVWT
jgi:hypothetical protein